MSLDLHPDLSPLPRWQSVVYGACQIVGLAGAVLFCLALLVEVLTGTPAAGRGWAARWWALIPVAYSLWHIGREVPAWGPLPRVRWLMFLASALALAFKAHSMIADPTAAIFFALAGLASFALVGAARLLARRAGPPRPEDGNT